MKESTEMKERLRRRKCKEEHMLLEIKVYKSIII